MGKDKQQGKPPVKGKPVRRTLGPVPNLEEHVPSEWWRQIFHSLYLKTDGDVVDDNRITSTEIDQIVELLKPNQDDAILDLCCGQGRHTLELSRRGFKNVQGLDRSHYLATKARERARAEGLSVNFKEGDARKLPYPPDTFNYVLILGNSFGYFNTSEDDLRVLKEVMRVLKPWGTVLLDLADGDFLRQNFQPRSWEWISKKMFVCRERSLSSDNDRLVSREVITHVDKGIIADQFYAERLYNPDRIKKLLEMAGFAEISFPVQLTPDSQRAQDLGMMERRIVATARVKKEWTPVKSKVKGNLTKVTVITGDPRKPDILKPSHVFDEDDFYTLDQMKEALFSLDGYHFSFLDNHDTLFQDLQKIVGKTDYVLNLCDEGFQNDPRKELHVPAMLEAFGIPYTGSNPQCLSYCYDKSLTRGIAKEMGIPVPEAVLIKPEDSTFEQPMSFPVLVKPNFGDSSFGITARSVCHTVEETLNAVSEIREKFGYDKPILVEEFLTGKDISVGIIGNPPMSYTVLPITEEDYSMLPPELPRICGYEAKWDPDSPYWQIKSIPADLPKDTERALIEWCVALCERLDCRDYARLDWRLNADGLPKLLEVNPNPGWCWDGHLAKMAAHMGMSYADTLAAILKSAEERISRDTQRELIVAQRITNGATNGVTV